VVPLAGELSSACGADADATAREALVHEAMVFGVPEAESWHVVSQHRDLEKARALLTEAARKRIQVA
jgi:hypothetical protein